VDLRDALTAELAAAMKRRDTAVTSAVRTALAALANAEAPTVAATPDSPAGSPHVAGATAGLATTEVPRLDLSEAHQRAIVLREHDELRAHAERLARLCRRDEADGARRAADALATALSSDAATPADQAGAGRGGA
jgi:hypothetical protein